MSAETAWPLAGILAMALATYAVRVAGHWIMGRVPLTPFVRAALEALPGAIVVSTIVPLGLRGGPSALIGIAATILAALAFRRDIVSLGCGLGTVIAVRALGLA